MIILREHIKPFKEFGEARGWAFVDSFRDDGRGVISQGWTGSSVVIIRELFPVPQKDQVEVHITDPHYRDVAESQWNQVLRVMMKAGEHG